MCFKFIFGLLKKESVAYHARYAVLQNTVLFLTVIYKSLSLFFYICFTPNFPNNIVIARYKHLLSSIACTSILNSSNLQISIQLFSLFGIDAFDGGPYVVYLPTLIFWPFDEELFSYHFDTAGFTAYLYSILNSAIFSCTDDVLPFDGFGLRFIPAFCFFVSRKLKKKFTRLLKVRSIKKKFTRLSKVRSIKKNKRHYFNPRKRSRFKYFVKRVPWRSVNTALGYLGFRNKQIHPFPLSIFFKNIFTVYSYFRQRRYFLNRKIFLTKIRRFFSLRYSPLFYKRNSLVLTGLKSCLNRLLSRRDFADLRKKKYNRLSTKQFEFSKRKACFILTSDLKMLDFAGLKSTNFFQLNRKVFDVFSNQKLY